MVQIQFFSSRYIRLSKTYNERDSYFMRQVRARVLSADSEFIFLPRLLLFKGFVESVPVPELMGDLV